MFIFKVKLSKFYCFDIATKLLDQAVRVIESTLSQFVCMLTFVLEVSFLLQNSQKKNN